MRLLTTGRERSAALSRPAAFEASLREAVSFIRAVRYDEEGDRTLVVVALLTGRTHQARVHLTALGHPVVGDAAYIGLRRWLCDTTGCGEEKGSEEEEDKGKDGKEEEEEEEDDVTRYYRGVTEEGASRVGRADGERGACVCPARICLHAWRYILRDGGSEAAERVLESPPPSWAVVE
ncbi:unnamed protein product [Phytomonas sp. EM1]|nr:unnamed protein product [Phytomonas sp. EM1]|eukprot:CCW65883.1 unnamed protein product [Phytomonas sp. isolate EM1]